MIVALSGGLGNQMFQYAFGRALSLRKGEPLYLDTHWFTHDEKRDFALRQYAVKYAGKDVYQEFNKRRLKVQRIPGLAYALGIHKEVQWYKKDFFVEHFNYDYYWGYWQNISYFHQIRDELQKEFSYQGPLTLEQETLVKTLQTSDCAGMHVRRGDYVSGGDGMYEILPEEYYRAAIEKIGNDMPIYCFSDDIEWCREHFSDIPKMVFVDKVISGSVDIDFLLMRGCKTFIMANSTLSWWAAWLGMEEGRHIITPQKWLRDSNQNERLMEALVPIDWERL